MDVSGPDEREVITLLARQNKALAHLDGEFWTLQSTPMKDRPLPEVAKLPEPSPQTPPAVHVPRLVPQRAWSRRKAGAILRGWGVFWLIVALMWTLGKGGDDLAWVVTCTALLLVTMIVPGLVLVASGKRDSRVFLPLEVIRDRMDSHGLHAIEVRDVAGPEASMTATRTLATHLLISSDFDGTGAFTGLTDVDRPRTTEEVAATAALVNPSLPPAFYAEADVERQLSLAARAANVDEEAVRARITQLVDDGVAGPAAQVSAPAASVSTPVVSVACLIAGLGWIPLAFLAERLATHVVSGWLA